MRRCALLILTLVLAAASLVRDARGADQPTEYQLKAAYIYHFAQFVEWPPSAFPQANSPLIIGVLGENPFGNDLRRTVQGKLLGNHPIVVQEFHSLSDLTNQCQILFISSSEKRLPDIFTSLNGTSTLTVGESDRFAEAGGMIRFVPEGGKIRFQINQTAVEKAGLKMSFKLLSLASKVTH